MKMNTMSEEERVRTRVVELPSIVALNCLGCGVELGRNIGKKGN